MQKISNYKVISEKTLNFFEKILGINRKPVYGPPPSMEMRVDLMREDAKEFNQSVYNFCDKLFKFFGWCIAIGILRIFWESTRFGLFPIMGAIMFLALFAYVISNSVQISFYFAKKISKKSVNPLVIFMTLVIPAVVTVFVVQGVFFAGMKRLILAQICSVYQKNSPDLPDNCRKYVR